MSKSEPSRKRLLMVFVVAGVMLIGLGLPRPQGQLPDENTLYEPPPRSKTTNCVVSGHLPDGACTPGAVMAGVTREQICTSGYATAVRNVPLTEKDEAYAAYTVTTRQAYEFQVDHLISLELGGSNDIANLWPQPSEPRPGYHEKDQIESYLHAQVCNGKMTLGQAQRMIATDWVAIRMK